MGGFSDGRIRLYSTSRGEKLVEIAAHARWINGLDMARGQGLVSVCVCVCVRERERGTRSGGRGVHLSFI